LYFYLNNYIDYFDMRANFTCKLVYFEARFI
jgi:hypothetical protein